MKPLFCASWIILLVASILIVLYSGMSVWRAYSGSPDGLSPTLTLEQMRQYGGEAAVMNFRGRRLTASAWGIGAGLLEIFVILGPYRRRERWAWWALLASIGLSQAISLARVFALGSASALASGIVLGFLLLGLLMGAPFMFAGRARLEPK